MRTSYIYAGRLERLLAYLIDTILVIVPSMFISGLLGGAPIAMLASFLFFLAYYTFFTASRWQATPGKRLLNMYVMRTDNRLLRPRDTLERFLAFILPSLPIYLSFIPANLAPGMSLSFNIVWFASILYTEERVGMHDKLCHTRVLIGKVGG